MTFPNHAQIDLKSHRYSKISSFVRTRSAPLYFGYGIATQLKIGISLYAMVSESAKLF